MEEVGVDCGGPCTACPTCTDGIQNQGEQWIDCGGPCTAQCPTCSDGIKNGLEDDVDCDKPGGLTGSGCAACPTCFDRLTNGDETGVDCGGSCAGQCPTCFDGRINGDEVDYDCGGSCPACPTCFDGVKNGDETLADCGGSCDRCPSCRDLARNGDELGIDCGGSCAALCPTCTDGVRNGDEVGVDCGGSCTGPCSSCFDGQMNGDEIAPDCGGSCGACPTCNDGVANGDETSVDCGGSCSTVACPTCTDRQRNGDEAGVDCGGSCFTQCPDPTCMDGVRNGDEVAVDCGGSCSTACSGQVVSGTAAGCNPALWNNGIGITLSGLMVTAVQSGSPAAIAGVQVGAEIVRLNGVRFTDAASLSRELARCPQPLSLDWLPPGEISRTYVMKDASGGVGIQYAGTVLTAVTPGSTAATAGLRPGMRLRRVNGVSVLTATDVASALAGAPANERFPIEVYHEGWGDQSVPVGPTTPGTPGTPTLPSGVSQVSLQRGTGGDYGYTYSGTSITGVTPGSTAAAAGLQAGQTIVQVNGASVSDEADIMMHLATVSPGSTYTMAVRSSGSTPITPPTPVTPTTPTTPGTPPVSGSCTDGIQNGNELGVDCGGACNACPSCQDGMRNGDEMDTDCGGSCTSCLARSPGQYASKAVYQITLPMQTPVGQGQTINEVIAGIPAAAQRVQRVLGSPAPPVLRKVCKRSLTTGRYLGCYDAAGRWISATGGRLPVAARRAGKLQAQWEWVYIWEQDQSLTPLSQAQAQNSITQACPAIASTALSQGTCSPAGPSVLPAQVEAPINTPLPASGLLPTPVPTLAGGGPAPTPQVRTLSLPKQAPGLAAPFTYQGTTVTSVPSSVARAGGLQPGMRITSINGRSVSSQADIDNALSSVPTGSRYVVQAADPGASSQSSSDDDDSATIGIIIGVIAGVLLCCLIALLIYCCVCKKKEDGKKQTEEREYEEYKSRPSVPPPYSQRPMSPPQEMGSQRGAGPSQPPSYAPQYPPPDPDAGAPIQPGERVEAAYEGQYFPGEVAEINEEAGTAVINWDDGTHSNDIPLHEVHRLIEEPVNPYAYADADVPPPELDRRGSQVALQPTYGSHHG